VTFCDTNTAERRMIQKYCDSRRQILEGSRRSRGIYRRGSERSSRTTRERIKKRREDVILERKNICS